jgi:hypothetical protein
MSKSGMVQRGEHSAQFEVEGDILTVTSPLGQKKTQVGQMPAEILAGQLLGELIAESHRKG